MQNMQKIIPNDANENHLVVDHYFVNISEMESVKDKWWNSIVFSWLWRYCVAWAKQVIKNGWKGKKNAAKKSPEIKAECKYNRESMRRYNHRQGKTGGMI